MNFAPSTLAFASGWTYVLDSFNDGTEAQTVGDASAFEMYGMAYRQQGNSFTFAINSNLPVNQPYARPNTALNGSINYGDLLLNFSQSSEFPEVGSQANSLYGIRFDAANDTELGLGLYRDVTVQSLSSANDGYESFAEYGDRVRELGGNPSLGGIELEPYFDPAAAPPTHIKTGELVSDIQEATEADLAELTFADQGAIGQYTFGFTVDASSLSVGDFIAHLLTECANDGIAFAASVADAQAVPEVSGVGSFLAMALMGGWLWRRKRKP